ncbi:hypothetical protein DSC45_19905 [Streptomyces sp. YIM 130001]|uniref:hypothetical protein n=1 Tax=Streptomyces sp. YIM 130001 TaxID=2259644 RepID=UPI000E651C7D|nr:hypothetical protein [Streptomyces sp. YIM 130001]RII14618.1 hypothetical protein DSC45_19905 [Streptomyces sp. YIM 130001]
MPRESEIAAEVLSCGLPTEVDLFDELSASVRWEDVGKGRQGAVLTKVDATGRAPLVRTTSRYSNPTQRFGAVHERLARQVQDCAATPVGFNNALIERYTNAYRTMGGHSDQALDLADGSFIALFSCYRSPEANPPRKLVFESKVSRGETFEVPLTHHSVVTFSVDSNRRLRHRILLDASPGAADNQWLGVTFRTSKTLVRYRDGHAFLPQGSRLTAADEEQQREFYGLRRRENHETDFTYPPLQYTVSESDLMPPV